MDGLGIFYRAYQPHPYTTSDDDCDAHPFAIFVGRLPSTMGDFSDLTPAETAEPGVGHGGLGPLPRLWRAAGAVALVEAVAICRFPLSMDLSMDIMDILW